MDIAIGNEDLWDERALPHLWEARNQGHTLTLLASEWPIDVRPPFCAAIMAPEDRWHLVSGADVYIGESTEVAEAFAANGGRGIIVGYPSAVRAHLALALVATWEEVPAALAWFQTLDSSVDGKIQVEYPNSVPGHEPPAAGREHIEGSYI